MDLLCKKLYSKEILYNMNIFSFHCSIDISARKESKTVFPKVSKKFSQIQI